jgi:endonuclease/exonuclease/phosphatase family metal-dependent hydrolase
MFRPGKKAVGVALVVIALGFHLVTFILYTRQPDKFAAFTLFPIWIWGAVGLSLSCSAFLFFRAPLALFATVAWTLTILILADEARSLGRIGHEGPEPGVPKLYGGRQVIRVATINWSGSPGNFSADIIEYQPDVVFIQEIPHPYRLKQLNDALYRGKGDYRYDAAKRCGVVVRGKFERQIRSKEYRSQHLTVMLPSSRRIELVNLHLQAASTDMRLWRRDCWRTHNINRKLRRGELGFALAILKEHSPFPRRPTIMAGDFNAPANDSVYRMLNKHFVDAFSASGVGWGNTYHRRLPILRLDHIYVTDAFIPARAGVVSIPESDHRMVVADLILR